MMDAFHIKRKAENSENCDETKKVHKESCPDSVKCNRRDPHHFRKFDHPHLEEMMEKGEPVDYPPSKQVIIEQFDILKGLKGLRQPKVNTEHIKPSTSTSKTKSTSYIPNNVESSGVDQSSGGITMAEKLNANAPYNLFFTTIPDFPATLNQKNVITFTDLLCPSLGELKCSLQINFVIDLAWLMEQYEKKGQGKKPLTILYGKFSDMEEYIQQHLPVPNVTEHHVKVNDCYGTHHPKVGIYVYSDNSLRVVVSTANLYYEDWNYHNQGLWISPLCPALPKNESYTAGDSPTNFKTTFLSFLETYNVPVLKPWIAYVKRADFSAVKCFYYNLKLGSFLCHLLLENMLPQLVLHTVTYTMWVIYFQPHCTLPAKSEGPLAWGIIAQSSNLGNMGNFSGEWLTGSLLRNLASHTDSRLTENLNATISVIYPTKDNVLNSYYGPMGAGCLPYMRITHWRQKWLKTYLHQWKADDTNRSRAMPHIKTYCRVSPCNTKLAWFLITSANLSKAAWGSQTDTTGKSYVRSYEAGVLYVPKFFDEQYFQIKDDGSGESKLFPFIYDLPLTSYKNEDEPWLN